jgi:hypothetical protein
MKQPRVQISAETANAPRLRARKDHFKIAVVVVLGCLVVATDPDRVFEWIAGCQKLINLDCLVGTLH